MDNRFLAWHYAEWSHGALLWVPPGLEIKEPFFIDFLEDGAGAMTAPHLAVLIGAGSRASVVHRVSALGGAASTRAGLLCNSVLDVRLGDAAGLRLWEQQELGPQDIFVRHAQAEVGRDASLNHFDAEFGARLAKSRVDCALDGAGAEAFLNGAYYCVKGQHMDLRTVQRHQSPKATSRAVYKGAVAGRWTDGLPGADRGGSPGASGTDAYLTNRNLILGEAARSDSIPTLKIGNNDVKCSHGSTTGRLNAEELFYLQTPRPFRHGRARGAGGRVLRGPPRRRAARRSATRPLPPSATACAPPDSRMAGMDESCLGGRSRFDLERERRRRPRGPVPDGGGHLRAG